ncbi:phosphoribosylformylglycinamidine synthase [Pasteurella skyensis]|uniref:Phosphoribosylformylglycinamidine synthase n=1 Tax=Phocoenobacter skyensis TaxID=97481 RepID=A0AAJ6N967_9PAST|nr:phosphoribosylformylglycinamidine synthase [Pasteurella skyensis]MDP8162889.1 phosphoribosylformylglycinamidine synthase [Pasteurella skyensis]MDP8172524.1 phosphoribosylformylglycinamidine synthase [Pasteurella skyensis]MDP8177713.1 phosphoribosylformylglycinamidine synthase [Pasteurella skyensis]MDP8179024.1 phosphoribosylformylglycinamidine synthase [Pasteurella skyensis]MDP8183291.1 phosphoribosylformylglycinamidine synthase [Pasteurella skyensis]
MMNLRFFVEKKSGFDIEAQLLLNKFQKELHIKNLHSLRIINAYDIFDLDASSNEIDKIKYHILSEPVSDDVIENLDLSHQHYFAIEYLEGQFDQRADSALQCIEIILSQKQNITVKSFKIIILEGEISHNDLVKMKTFYINPIECQEKHLDLFKKNSTPVNDNVVVYDNFVTLDHNQLLQLKEQLNLSMSKEDFFFIQQHYQQLGRNPTETELKVFDTYWSDHCRHTTFETQITHIDFPDSPFGKQMQAEFAHYLAIKAQVAPHKKQCLMDMATVMAKYLHQTGHLDKLEISEENNACSIYIDVHTTDFNGNQDIEKWLLMFKNETHNHPTEIEPFGGASTCLGGAIRDPLSGRAYVYQAIRVTGSANPLEKIEDTLSGKLSQQKITTEAAKGYSSYGNQIGIATSLVSEIYHQGYKAKRLEVGAVVGAAPVVNVRRQSPEVGDVIILLGGKTGRDGCGGASGSSKEHNDQSLLLCGAEVQKGNAPEERKIQRLFRNANATKLIKKCNDFGAGGVCVAIGELAEGVFVDLDLVPVKYQGLSGTELAISESQERMAVVVDKKDSQAFLDFAAQENILAKIVGKVTANKALVLSWKKQIIVDIQRDFLNTNGISQKVNVKIKDLHLSEKFKGINNIFTRPIKGKTLAEQWQYNIQDLNVASQKGLVEMFDSTVGAGTVLMPFGGRYQMTPVDVSIAKIPVLDKETNTVSAITWGFNPYLLEHSPYHGAMYAVIDSLAKLVAAGVDYKKAYLSFQEYFPKLGTDGEMWSKPLLALLGAIRVQTDFQIAAIGGKDSMSGTFNDLQVPSTFISFAVNTGKVEQVISPEFKQKNSFVYLIDNPIDDNGLYSTDKLKANFDFILENIRTGNILSAMTVKHGGIAEAITKMSFGQRLGIKLINHNIDYFAIKPAAIIIESNEAITHYNAILLGHTIDSFNIITDFNTQKETIDLAVIQQQWLSKFAKIFPVSTNEKVSIITDLSTHSSKQISYNPTIHSLKNRQPIAKPRVLIATFPGSNSEYDMYNAFNRNGGCAEILLFRNITSDYINDSIDQLCHQLKTTQIFVLPGGFSAGDEPDGSGKFIAAILQNPRLKDSINEFLARDGLVLGICNGFQALVKSGLLPNANIGQITPQSPTLTFNKIGRHISQMVTTKIVNNQSPWLSSFAVGQTFNIPVSHGEGRFYASEETLQQLIANGQIATQYVDLSGRATNEFIYNPNGSSLAIEGIMSADGRILGKMGHSERYSEGTFKNISGDNDQNIFVNGINYFR